MRRRNRMQTDRELSIGRVEDVEYSAELADTDDLKAQARAEAAERRQSGQAESANR